MEEQMQVDSQASTSKGLATAGSSTVIASNALASGGSVTAFLHPLVIMNISEHWTRLRSQEGSIQPIYGALIGKQQGRLMEIMNSFELSYDRDANNAPQLDTAYYAHKEEQFKQVFPDLDFLGWYTAGDEPTEQDVNFHKQICLINESPVLLKLNPFEIQTKLPIRMFESVIDLANGVATMSFIEISYTLVTEEAERIGLDHMTKLSSTQQGGTNQNSVVAEHLKCQYNAVKMLRDRVRLILEYVKDVQAKQLPVNHEVLREVFSLCHRLPLIEDKDFSDEFYNQYNDVALISYLGTLTKSTNSLNQFINKFGLLCERPAASRRLRSIF